MGITPNCYHPVFFKLWLLQSPDLGSKDFSLYEYSKEDIYFIWFAEHVGVADVVAKIIDNNYSSVISYFSLSLQTCFNESSNNCFV